MIRRYDSQGREIEVGQRVAYNMSGQVVPGVVLAIHPGHIKIRCESTQNRRPDTSRVKNSRGIMVLAGVAVEGPNGSRNWLLGRDA